MSRPYSPSMEQARHELLSDLASQVAVVLAEFNVSDAIAEQAGSAIADHVAERWGGQLINIPKDYRYNLSKRDLEIYERVRGNNLNELAREYGISVRAIYRVIQRTKRMAVARHQNDLFNEQ